MSKLLKIIIFFTLSVVFGTAYALAYINPESSDVAFAQQQDEPSESSPRTVKNPGTETVEDLNRRNPMDLQDPANTSSEPEYNTETDLYYFRNRVGNMDVSTPFTMTGDEYLNYSLRESMNNYWREKVKNDSTAGGSRFKFDLSNINLNLGGKMDNIFGPGGVQVKLQGSAELLFGFKINKVQNPTLSERMRNPPPIFDFDQKIQLTANAKVGDKINFNMNYNTEASFDQDQSQIKLAYEGKEDEIVRSFEAGNVTMPLNSSLIRGSSALFGFKTELQFGKLSVAALLSQQQSETKNVSLKNGAQTTEFTITADSYDENRHFFLSHYFRDNFEKSIGRLPNLNSGVQINRVEVWITNKTFMFEQARNVVAFMDLGETNKIDNSHWTVNAGAQIPFNNANTLYREVIGIPNIRDIQQVNSIMDGLYSGLDVDGGEDYEKVESARRLDPTEYTLNPNLGFISLRTQLNNDEVLAVAFEYTYGGKVYQVGEFSTDGIDAPQALFVKLLKGTAFSPEAASWDLMMKNIYSLNAMQVEAEDFEMQVMYQSDSAGIYVPYIPEGNIKNQSLLKVLRLDRLNRQNQLRPDGVFDFVPGYTILPDMGRIIFPVLEPFGSNLREAIGNDAIADKYVFQELYDYMKAGALEYTEKNKFRLQGRYKGSSTSEIRLNAMNVPRGSVTVTAGGITLVENVDYTVDYSMGTVTILNQAYLNSNTPINVSLESQSMFSMQRKSLMGVHLEYQFNKDLSVGGTLMHFSEKPLTTKVNMGSEPMSNTIWGLNLAYKRESQLITNILDKLPFLKATAPSTFTINGEFAQLIPGHPKVISQQGLSYIDDFESSKTSINILYPYAWFLASVPRTHEKREPPTQQWGSSNLNSGINRALLAWYTVDPLFWRPTNTTPNHIRNDEQQLSDHRVRKVQETEIFPYRDPIQGQENALSVLNLSFYPTERGPYNLDAQNIAPNGSLLNPTKRWGGIMRKMDVTDFEAANIEYIEFWLMDPFLANPGTTGGDLYFNLGEISEDILRDGKKSFENGLPANGDTLRTERTVWGRVPRTQSMVNAFDNEESSRQHQDVGLDGLRNMDEYEFTTYNEYLTRYQQQLSAAYIDSLQRAPFSPLNDPAGDNYRYFRGTSLDNEETSILERYKYYNGLEGNSPVTASTNESFSSSSSNLPNVEDINQDNNLNEYEKYFEYKISLRPQDMQVGQNYITDVVEPRVSLENGVSENVRWYQFKIPIRDQNVSIEGNLSAGNFKSIRFMRVYMSGFENETHLRFATMELVRGDWRVYDERKLNPASPSTTGTLDISVVNIEENGNKKPVNYLLPPGVDRQQDPSQAQIREENEQSLLLKVSDLTPGDARAVYKHVFYDMRQFKRLQMFVHAEKLIDDLTNLRPSDLTVFMRIGSDLTENYYEYEIPLQLTPHGVYSDQQRADVWQPENMFDFPLSSLTDVKIARNRERRKAGSEITLRTPYSQHDPEKMSNKITIVGNPNLAEVQNIMIGVRNQSREAKSGEVWVNELRLSGFNEDGGYAALANATLNLSDVGSVSVAGRIETTGFGAIEDNVLARRMDDYTQINVSANVEAGRFLPEQAKLRVPLFYSFSREVSKPKYDPYNQDLLLTQTLDEQETQHARDSIKNIANTVFTTQSVSLNNVKVDIQSKKPQLYDPANISFSYMYTRSDQHSPEVERNVLKDYRGTLAYQYAVTPKPWEPFKNVKALNKPIFKIIKDINFYYLPNTLAYSTTMSRYYNEVQLRNLDNPEIDYNDPMNPLLSSSKDFIWNRKFDIKYDLSRGLRFSFSTATNASIDETRYTPVNKELFPTEYENWKDTVWRSIGQGGAPLSYQQMFTASYTLPLNKIPIFSWITSNIMYTGNYTWDRGAMLQEDEEAGRRNPSLGNNITSLGSWQWDGRFNLEQLYNKSSYLKAVNQRFSGRKSASANNQQKPAAPRTNEQKIKLKKGEKFRLSHRLNSETVRVNAQDEKGNEYKLKYKVLDRNSIEIRPKEDIELTIKTTQKNPQDAKGAALVAQGAARFLMMVRNVSFNYNRSDGMMIGGYKPETGILGQDAGAPGIAFTLGYQEPDFMQKAFDKNWLVNDSTIGAAVRTHTSDLMIRAQVEPITGLKIDFGVTRNYATNDLIQYQYEGMPSIQSGSFSMSTIAIKTLFRGIGSAEDNYRSQTYEEFLAKRHEVAAMLNSQYAGRRYPNSGFMSEGEAVGLAGAEFDGNRGFSHNSTDVLIPAFFAAYTGTSVKKDRLNLIPALMRMLPNWRITYDGLSRLPFIKDHFKSINLTHAYTCKYNIGVFNTYGNWLGDSDGWGFVPDVQTGLPVPSSQYDVPSVSITENFNPLIRLDATLNNSLTFSTEYRRGRVLALNVASTQIVESANNEFVIGLGYRLDNFDLILKLKNDKENKVKNDLTLRCDFSLRDNKALIRKLDDDEATQATSGDKTIGVQVSAEYVFSSRLNFRLYYDYQSSSPLISSSFPTSNSNFGIAIKILLTRMGQ